MDVDMDQETAKKLLVEGATIIFLGIPEGSYFGIDLDCWRIQECFRGFKMIPPGLHFVYYSGNQLGSGKIISRSSIMHFFAKKEMYVKVWDKTTEDMRKNELTEESIQQLKDNLLYMDKYLAPYPYENWPKWKLLTSQITADLAKKLAPESGIIRSCVELLPMSDEERPRGVKSSSKPTDTSSTKSTKTSSTKSTDTSSTKYSDISYTKLKYSNSLNSTESHAKFIDSSSTNSTDTFSATFLNTSSTKSTDVSNTMSFDSTFTQSTNDSSIKSADTFSIKSTDASSRLSKDTSSKFIDGSSTTIGTTSSMSIDIPFTMSTMSIDTDESTSQSSSNRAKRFTQQEREDAMLPKLKPVPGVSMRYTEVPRDKYPLGSSPSEITKHCLDQSYSLEFMISQYDEPLHIIGELQVAYLCFRVGDCLDSFEHWKNILVLLCSCDAAIHKYRTVYFHFIKTIDVQIDKILSDFLEDIVTHKNVVYKKLREFFRMAHASKIDGRLLAMIERLREHLTCRLHWDFTGLDVDEEDERPVVVQLGEADLYST